MPRKKVNRKVTRRSTTKGSSGISSWFQRGREVRLEKSEERDWRRRLILAGRKIQMVQMALTADLSDVRGLRKGLQRSRPEMKRLEQELEASRGVVGSLESKLEEHASLLRAALEHQQVQQPGLEPGFYEERLISLEGELERVQTDLIHEQETHAHEIAALQAEKEALSCRPLDGGVEGETVVQLELALSQGEKRARELETMLRRSEERRAMQAAHHGEEVHDLRKLTESRINELEGELERVRTRAKSVPVTGSGASAEDETTKRIAELELQLRGLGTVRADLHQAQEELSSLRDESTNRTSALEARLRSAEEERARLMLRHETEVEALRRETHARLQELSSEAETSQQARSNLEQELVGAHSEGEGRVQEVEEKLARLAELEAAEAAQRTLHQRELQATTERFESQISELKAQLRQHDTELERVQKAHGHELAESAARVLEVEAFNQELERARKEAEERTVESQRFAEELEYRLRQLERERDELENRFDRQVSDLSTANESRLQELEEELVNVRRERDVHMRDHTRDIEHRDESFGRVMGELKDRLRQSEMARIEIETRHQTAMTDFADHSRARLQRLQDKLQEKEQGIRELVAKVREKDTALETVHSVLQEKERELKKLKAELDEKERANSRLEAASDELKQLQDELQFSGEKLEEQTSRLLDLMQNVEGEEDWAG